MQSLRLLPSRLVRFAAIRLGPSLASPPPYGLTEPLGATLEQQHLDEIGRREELFTEARLSSSRRLYSSETQVLSQVCF
ncbi:unnamed protein product [Protopolystoma xenopodis]|uniref:Uncharacterized protein n=1 Tax=Protopolystoma xenopodis TaxID=117903 RepID=A0A448WMR1_9PLAT|nr:unnamed protein product [Protopolystoma xenopodis]